MDQGRRSGKPAQQRTGSSRHLVTLWLVVIAMVAAACGGATGERSPQSVVPASTTVGNSSGGAGGATGSGAGVEPMALEEAAAALNDPTTAVDAVAGILDALEIGVYDVDGTPIAPGAETSNDDLWLSTAEVAGLAEAARRDSVPFSQMADLLNGLAGTDFTAEEVAEMYRTMVEELPDHPMSRVLGALGTDLRADGEITPFEGWLLLVAMTPPETLDGPQALGGLAPAGAAVAVAA